MSRISAGSSSSKNHIKFKLVIYLLSILIALALLEIYTRAQYSDVRLLYLPYFGLSEDQHNLLIWQHQPEQYEVGTITTPYPFDLYNSMLGWKIKPNADVMHSKLGRWKVRVTTNSFGLRGTTPNEQYKAANVVRIGIVGASQTFGE